MKTEIKIAFDAMIDTAHNNSRSKGFWEEDHGTHTAITKIALMGTELAEMIEALRHSNPPDNHCPDFSSLAIEAADLQIRLLDFCGRYNIDLASAMFAKMAYNAERSYMHGKKA